jgi:beta-glucosidase
MNLWARPTSNAKNFATIGCQAHRDVARKAVRESLVLLKNEGNVLPLNKSKKVVVCGEWADSIGWQCGGWTKNWQGDVTHGNAVIGGTSLLDGMQALGGANVVYRPDGANIDGDASAIVVFLGEIPFAETMGDDGHVMDSWFNNTWVGYKISLDLTTILAENDRLAHSHFANLLNTIKSQRPNIPLVVVLLSSRPVIISPQLDQSSAFVAAWFPGTEGKGVAEVLYQDNGCNFMGKLTHSWPTSLAQIPINVDPREGEQAGTGGEPLFKYGFGLTY